MLHYDFILMLLLDEGACMPVHEEEGEEESCFMFFLLTYILNLSTCLIYSMSLPAGLALWGRIMLLLIFVLSEVLLDYRVLQLDAKSDQKKRDKIKFLQIPGLPSPNVYSARNTWSSWGKSSRGV